MKRNIFYILLISLACSLSAQDRLLQPEMYFGLSGGVVASQVGFAPTVMQGYSLGFNGGGMFRYIADEYFGLQMEMNFTQMGWKEEEKIEGKTTEIFSRKLNYLEIPFLTHIYFGKRTRIFANLGPQIVFLLSQTATSPPAQTTESRHLDPVKNTFDYGFAAGLGVVVPIRRTAIQLEIRGYYGMNDIYSNAMAGARSNNWKASVNLGWMWRRK